MDGFSLAVLERTLELVIDAVPPDQDPAVAEGVNAIRRYLDSTDTQNAAHSTRRGEIGGTCP